ncbi:hypothetical protein EON63_00340 [archaeon]|nr:MAG: hypothetical protein EON63_00340 [archaeon]
MGPGVDSDLRHQLRGYLLLVDPLKMPKRHIVRNELLAQHGIDIGKDVIICLLNVTQQAPLVGPFVEVLKQGIKICQNFKANENAAQVFKERLLDAAYFVLIAVEKCTSKLQVINKYAKKLTDVVTRANQYLEKFSCKGFLAALLVGSKPKEKLEEFDAELTRAINDMVLAVDLTNLSVANNIYDVACNIEQWIHEQGGYSALVDNKAKLEELARRLGENFVFECAS